MKRKWPTILFIPSMILLLTVSGLIVYNHTHQGSGKAPLEIQYERTLDYNNLVNDAYTGNPEFDPLKANTKIEWIIRKANLNDQTLENLFVKYDDNKVYLVQIKVFS